MSVSPEVDGVAVELRRGVMEDFDGILVLLRQLWPELELDPRAVAEVFGECLRSDDYVALCAVARGRVVGFCDMTVKPSLWKSGKLAYVDDLVVDEAARGKGIGAKLLERVSETAVSLGCVHIMLDSFFHREDAHRFYEGRGMERNGFTFGRDI